jgi:Protein tyrosine and serine/threonine kinase
VSGVLCPGRNILLITDLVVEIWYDEPFSFVPTTGSTTGTTETTGTTGTGTTGSLGSTGSSTSPSGTTGRTSTSGSTGTTGSPVVPRCTPALIGQRCVDEDFCSANSTCQDVSGAVQCVSRINTCNITAGVPEFVLTLALNCSTFESGVFRQVLLDGTGIDPRQLHFTAAQGCNVSCFGAVTTISFVLVNSNGTALASGSVDVETLNATLYGTLTNTSTGGSANNSTGSGDNSTGNATVCARPANPYDPIDVVVVPYIPPFILPPSVQPEMTTSSPGPATAESSSSDGIAWLLPLIVALAVCCICCLFLLLLTANWRRKRHHDDSDSSIESSRSVQVTGMIFGVEIGGELGNQLLRGTWQDTTEVVLRKVEPPFRASALDLLRESTVLATARHPNVMRYFGIYQEDSGESDGSFDGERGGDSDMASSNGINTNDLSRSGDSTHGDSSSSNSNSDSGEHIRGSTPLKSISVLVVETAEREEEMRARLSLQRPFFFTYEYMQDGSLADRLKATKSRQLSVLVLSSAALQIASGMAYLINEVKVLHRALRLKRVLCRPAMNAESVGYKCKLSGFGFTQVLRPHVEAIYQDAAANDGDPDERPIEIRYLAPEAILRPMSTRSASPSSSSSLVARNPSRECQTRR